MEGVLWFALSVQAVMCLIFAGILAYGIKQLKETSQSAFEHLKARSLEDLSEFRKAEVEKQVYMQNLYDFESDKAAEPQMVTTLDGRRIPVDELDLLG